MSWTTQFVAIAGSFIVTPALLRGLGEARYGAWLLVMSFVGQLRMLDLGMSAGTMKYSAGALARDDQAKLRCIHCSAAAMFVLAAALALLGTSVLVLLLPRAFPEALGGQQGVVLVLGLVVTMDLFLHPQLASIRARSLYYIPDLVESISYLVFKFGLVLYLAGSGLSLWLLALLTLGDSLVRNLILSVSALWLCPWTRHLSPRAVDKGMLRTLALFGGGMLLINLGEILRFQLDSAVIGYFLAPDLIAVYAIGMRLVHVAYQGIGVIGGVLVPRFSGLFERGDRAEFERLLGRANLATALVTGYVLVNIALLGEPFLRMWIDKPWIDDAFRVTLIMLPGYFVGLLSTPGVSLLIGAGRLRGMTALTLAEAACNLGLSLALVRPLGIYGVCLGTAIPMAAFRGVLFPFVLRRYVGIKVGTYLGSVLRSGLLALGYALLVLPLRALEIEGPLAFVATGACSTAIFGGMVLVALPEARTWLLAKVGLGRG